MGDQITVAMRKTYNGGVTHLLQEKGSEMRLGCTPDSALGKEAKLVDQLGESEAQLRTTRHQETPLMEIPHAARWVRPKTWEWAELIDPTDKLQILMDPANKYAEAGAMGMARRHTDAIVQGALGNNWVGEDGDEIATFDNNMIVPVGTGAASATRLNIPKLRQARKFLRKNHVDLRRDPAYLAISAEQDEDLLRQIEAISLDYNEKPVLRDGMIDKFMGFNFLHTERLPADSNGYRQNLFWAKSGMCFVTWEGLFTSVDPRIDRSMSTQVFVRQTFNACRTEEKKVGYIQNTETP